MPAEGHFSFEELVSLSNATMAEMISRGFFIPTTREDEAKRAAEMADRIGALKARYDDKLWQSASEALDKISLDEDINEEEIAEATAAIADAMVAWRP